MSGNQSNLKPYSLGIVVETKPRGTDYILVSPIEELNIQSEGSIKDHTKDFKGEQSDLESTSFKTEHESKNYIRAKWLPYSESNRTTAPDVVANETVMLYKFGDVDEYYWFDVMREPELRRLEDVLYSYSNQKSGQTPFDKDSSYWVRYNTKDKYIHLHTSKNDGEPFTYDILIDTKTGYINVKDDVGNFMEFNSSTNSITLRALHAITLDAPILNLRSSNGCLGANSKGVKIEGNVIENNTTVSDREIYKQGEIDSLHTQGDLSGSRFIAPITDTSILNFTKYKQDSVSVKYFTEVPLRNTKTDTVINESTVIQNTATTTENKSNTILNQASSITNDTPIVNNTGNVETTGYDRANPNLNATH